MSVGRDRRALARRSLSDSLSRADVQLLGPSYGAQVPVLPVLTAQVLVPLWSTASVTVSETLYVPVAGNLWLTVAPEPLVLSPNTHVYDVIPLSSVELVPLKLHVRPFLALVQFHVYRETGEASAGGVAVVADAVFENPEVPAAFVARTR